MSTFRYDILTATSFGFAVASAYALLCSLVFPSEEKSYEVVVLPAFAILFYCLAKTSRYTFQVANPVVVAVRVREPSDFKFEIANYQELLNSAARTGSHRIESSEFNAGGCSWALVMYPNGNKKDDSGYNVSLYLRLVNIPTGGRAVFASFKFFIFDKPHNTYVTINTADHRRFDAAHAELGIARAIPIVAFTEQKNGLLMNNSCTIGAEVYVTRNTATVACLSLMKEETRRTYEWRVSNYSTLSACVYSDSFPVERLSWKLCLYPKGNRTGKGRYLSLYLDLEDHVDLTGGGKLYVECALSVRDQLSGNNHEKTFGFWFDSKSCSHGFDQFLRLAELNNPNNGYGHDNTLFIEANLNEMFTLQETKKVVDDQDTSA